MQRAWLMAVLAIAAASAQAEEPAQTDKGVTVQLKNWMISDAFEGEDENFSVLYVQPYYAVQPDPDDIFFIKGNLYASNQTGADETSISAREEARYFAEIPEFWWQHSSDDLRHFGRIGMQKFDDLSGLWWNAPLTGLSYRFDSTLLRYYIAAGDRSSYLRTDWDQDDPQANSALYGLTQLSWQWKLDQYVILRAAYRQDKDNEYAIGQTYDTAEMSARPLEGSWAGLEWQGERHVNEDHWPRYEIEGAWMQGQQIRYHTTTTGPETVQVKSRTEKDLQGYMARLSLQQIWQYHTRWVIGAEALYASGGDGIEGGFVQTGINTNRDALYTTHLSGSMTGEALRMTISNIVLAGAHVAFSWQDRHEGFIAVRQAWRADEQDEVLLDSRLPPNGSKDLGLEVDIAYGWYMPILGQRRGLQMSEFKGKQFMVYASHFEPDFTDPLVPVSGTVVGARFIWSF
ncbi:MAG: transcriptional regulator [Moraxellaceae bacterium]|jgi:hypothetical protein|nr:transcriptional regulator [Moraxellaceae bacterium]